MRQRKSDERVTLTPQPARGARSAGPGRALPVPPVPPLGTMPSLPQSRSGAPPEFSKAAAQFSKRAGDPMLDVSPLLSGVRKAQGQSEAMLAGRLGTSADVVRALEAGQLASLPPWPETHRIVEKWLADAGFDPRPALVNLERVFAARSSVPAAKPAGPSYRGQSGAAHRHGNGAKSLSRLSGEVGDTGGRSRRALLSLLRPPRLRLDAARRALSRRPSLFSVGFGLPPSRSARILALVIVLVVLGGTASQTQVVAGALAKLPAPAERAVRSISDFFAVRFAPLRQGHRWIEVDDPRSRRGDKLRIGRHSD